MQYSEEQVRWAKSTDLVLFLQSQGEKLVKSGKEYRWMAHDSLTSGFQGETGMKSTIISCLSGKIVRGFPGMPTSRERKKKNFGEMWLVQ